MRFILLTVFAFFTTFLHADEVTESNPNEVIHLVSENTFKRITSESSTLKEQPNHIIDIINEELIPYIDYKYASYIVMGANLKTTTKEQREAFVEAFKGYLIHAYGHILLEYDQQEFEIVDNPHYKDKKIVSIPVRIRDKNNQVTQATFKLRKNKKTGQWKVFDVLAEGVSMLDTKKSELGEIMRKQGVDHVIGLLQDKNEELATTGESING